MYILCTLLDLEVYILWTCMHATSTAWCMCNDQLYDCHMHDPQCPKYYDKCVQEYYYVRTQPTEIFPSQNLIIQQ